MQPSIVSKMSLSRAIMFSSCTASALFPPNHVKVLLQTGKKNDPHNLINENAAHNFVVQTSNKMR